MKEKKIISIIVIATIVVFAVLIIIALWEKGAENQQTNPGGFVILSIKPDANLSVSEMPLTTYLEVQTGGNSSQDVCYYSNTEPMKWVKFHETDGKMHKQSIMFPYSGYKNISIMCVSENNETIFDNAEFWVNEI